MRRRCTPSGLTRTRVRSTVTARKSDMRASDRDRLLESCLAAERPHHRRSEPARKHPRRELADLARFDRVEARHELLGLDDRALEQELLTRVLAQGRCAL